MRREQEFLLFHSEKVRHPRMSAIALTREVRAAFSIVEAARAALRLDVAAVLFAFEPALFRSQRRPGRPSRNRAGHGFAQQLDQTVDRISAVALLGAEALRMNHDHAVLGHALASEPG